MSQPYPDPPFSTPLVNEKTKAPNTIWSKWLQGLRTNVNRLSVGFGINATLPIAPVPPATIPGSITIRDGVVTQIVPPT